MRPSAERDPLSPRARLLLPLLLIALLAFSLHRYRVEPERTHFTASGAALGTTWSVKVAGELEAEAERAIAPTVEETIARIDASMSTWKEHSELSHFNTHAAASPFSVSEDLTRVLELSASVTRLSGGAFDVTVLPLVQAWGFGAGAAEEVRTPEREELVRLRRLVGPEMLQLDAEKRTLVKRQQGVQVDLSAVAKGFAVDEVATALLEAGHDRFLVEIGGELRASGLRHDGEPWRVAIEEPVESGRAIHRVVALRDAAMATSGDYRNYREVDGERVSHTIDPRSGRPITHRLASVTVIDGQAARADAWATALNVLGPEAGYALARKQGLAAYFIVRSDEGAFETLMTRRFEPWLLDAPAE